SRKRALRHRYPSPRRGSLPALAPLSPFCSLFKHPAPPPLSTLSLHDALPIYDTDPENWSLCRAAIARVVEVLHPPDLDDDGADRSEEHTSELQSLTNLVCRLLLEKKNREFVHSRANSGGQVRTCLACALAFLT